MVKLNKRLVSERQLLGPHHLLTAGVPVTLGVCIKVGVTHVSVVGSTFLGA